MADMKKWLDRRDFGDYDDYKRAQYDALLPWAKMGDPDAIDWLADADLLFAYRESRSGPKRKEYSKPPRPTLDDFEKPGVIWGNA